MNHTTNELGRHNTPTLDAALHQATAEIDDHLYYFLLEETDPLPWLQDPTLRYLGELQKRQDPRYDVLETRAFKLAGIARGTLQKHIVRVMQAAYSDQDIAEELLDDLLDADIPPPCFTIPAFLPVGAFLVIGKKNSGKSMFVWNAALAVGASGTAFSRYPVPAGGDVLVYALEDPRARIKKRVRQMRQGARGPTRITVRYQAPAIGQGLLEDMAGWLAEHPDAKLIVIDILAKIRTMPGRQTDFYLADYQAVAALEAFAQRHGISILICHHTRKTRADDPFDEVLGTGGLAGGVNGVFAIRRQRGHMDAVLHATGRDLDDYLELSMTFDPVRAWWTIEGNADEIRPTRERDETCETLATMREPFGPDDLSAMLDLAYDTAQKRLVRLYEAGLLDRAKRGQYTRTPTFYTQYPPPTGKERVQLVSDCPIVRNDTQPTELQGTEVSDTPLSSPVRNAEAVRNADNRTLTTPPLSETARPAFSRTSNGNTPVSDNRTPLAQSATCPQCQAPTIVREPTGPVCWQCGTRPQEGGTP